MRLVQVARDDTMMVSGYEHHAMQCPACGEVERRMVFNSGGPARAAEPNARSPLPAATAPSAPEAVSPPTAPPASNPPAVAPASPPTVPAAAAALSKPALFPRAAMASSPTVKPDWPSVESAAHLGKPPSPATAPLKSIVAEDDDAQDGGQAMLLRAIEMVRSATRRPQPTKSQPPAPAKAARPTRMKKPLTDRVVEICHDPQEAIYFAKDTKSGLSVLRHQDSGRLRAMCDRIGWQVIEGGIASAKE
jgi:hypothetical protein